MEGSFCTFTCKSTINANFTKIKKNSVSINLSISEMRCLKKYKLPVTGNIPTKVTSDRNDMEVSNWLHCLKYIKFIYRLI